MASDADTRRGRGRPFVPDWLGTAPPAIDARQGVAPVFVPDWMRAETGPVPIDRGPAAGRPASEAPPLVVRGGRVVLPGMGVFDLELRLESGRVHAIGRDLDPAGAAVFEAAGAYVLPGLIDPHTHVGLFAGFAEEAASESRSALLNGVTTMGVYLASHESYLEVLDAAIAAVDERAAADIFFHLPIFSRRQLEEIPLYRARYGVTSFKAYMSGIPGMIPSLDDGFLAELMQAVAELGPEAVLNIHAENPNLVASATAQARVRRPQEIRLTDWAATHPPLGEAEAVRRAAFLARPSGATLYFVHISAAETVEAIRGLKSEGCRFFAETTSPYLTLTDRTALGALAKMVPPIRTEADQEALWRALSQDLIDAIGSDHTPLTRAEKKASGPLWEALPGYPAVGTHLPSLLDAAGRRGYPLAKLAEKTAWSPARIFGLAPRKGTLLPGSDADLVVVDPNRVRRVEAQAAGSRSDFALHEGSALTGWPTAVFKAGAAVVMDGKPCRGAAPAGRYLYRGGPP
jgi:dihydropyrimidinase